VLNCKGKTCAEDSCKTPRSTITSSKYRTSPLRLTNMERDLRRTAFTTVAGVLLTGLMMVGAVTTPVGATGTLPPDNPVTNLAPSPNFLSSGTCNGSSSSPTPCSNPCVRMVGPRRSKRIVFPSFSGTPSCTKFVLRALNVARAQEDLPAIVLPTNWYHLKPQEQLFVIVNLERTARGLPPYLGLNRQLHASAQSAAAHVVDPTFAKGFTAGLDPEGVPGMGGTLAMGYTTLEADYVWMYEDGWGGSSSSTPNIACTNAGALGCWGHRDQLLGFDGAYNFGVGLHCTTCEMGTGFAVVNRIGSFTSLIELPAGSPPPMYFTWAKDVVPFLATSEIAPG
jgi:hypothetical protein